MLCQLSHWAHWAVWIANRVRTDFWTARWRVKTIFFSVGTLLLWQSINFVGWHQDHGRACSCRIVCYDWQLIYWMERLTYRFNYISVTRLPWVEMKTFPGLSRNIESYLAFLLLGRPTVNAVAPHLGASDASASSWPSSWFQKFSKFVVYDFRIFPKWLFYFKKYLISFIYLCKNQCRYLIFPLKNPFTEKTFGRSFSGSDVGYINSRKAREKRFAEDGLTEKGRACGKTQRGCKQLKQVRSYYWSMYQSLIR